ncbi:MAG: sensor histidine kinase [Massiliimalia sp.]|jgi:hypothetical protein
MLSKIQTMIDLFETEDNYSLICDEQHYIIWENQHARESEFASVIGQSAKSLSKMLGEVVLEALNALEKDQLFLKEVKLYGGVYLLKAKRFLGDDQKPYSWWGIRKKKQNRADRFDSIKPEEQNAVGMEYREAVFHIYNALPPLMQILEKYSCYDEMVYLNIVAQGAQSILKTTINLTEYVKFQNGDNPMCVKKILIPQFLRQFVSAIEPLTRNSGRRVVLQEHCQEDLCITADEEKLTLMLLNLLVNAIQFSIKETAITIDVRKVGSEAVISIRDIGDGIEPSRIEQVGTPFYSYHPATKQRNGVGLGMYLTRKIMEAHGGTFLLTSRPNEGTTVSLRFPAGSVPPLQGFHSYRVTEEMIGNKMSMLYAFLAPVCHVNLF